MCLAKHVCVEAELSLKGTVRLLAGGGCVSRCMHH